MNDVEVRQWYYLFQGGKTNFHDEEYSGRSSLITDDLSEKIDNQIFENCCFTVSQLTLIFLNVSRSVILEVLTGKLA